MLKANYHTHTYLCGHANGDVSDYVNEAIKLGYKELGMSDHAHTPRSFMTLEEYNHNMLYQMMDTKAMDEIYIPKVLEAKKSSKIKVFLGLETEYFKKYHDYFVELKNKVEYLNLGMHFVMKDDKIYSPYDPFDSELVYLYTEQVIEGMATGLFTTLAHPDLFMMNYYSEKGHRVFDEVCVECSKKIIEAAIKYDVYLEINANGIRKGLKETKDGKMEYLYPRSEFWEIASKYKDAKIIIGVDAHDPSHLSLDTIDKAEELAKRYNIELCEYINFKESK